MKTQVFKHSETKSSNSMMVLTMIIFAVILFYAATKMQSHFKSSTMVLQKKFVTEEPFSKMYRQVNSASRNNAIETATSGVDYMMEKMTEYLIPEVEPQLEVSEFTSISFSEFEPTLIQKNTLNNDLFLNDLKMQASQKTNEAVEYYALEKKLSEFLIADPENKLEIEEWMIREN